MALTVQQSARYDSTKARWDWALWIVGTERELDTIAYVVYALHPSHPNPARIARQRASRFQLLGRSWGGFRVKVRVVRRNGKQSRHDVDLRLVTPDGKPAPPLELLGDLGSAREKYDWAMRFKKELKAFDYARLHLANACAVLQALPAAARDDSTRKLETQVVQQLALCTYKDISLSLDARLDAAIRILGGPGPALENHTDPETLGLVGAIYKRKWEVDRQRTHLEMSLRFYEKGYNAACKLLETDEGYDGGGWTGINAAYVHDLLANEQAADGGPALAEQREPAWHRAQAVKLRREIITTLEQLCLDPARLTWWLLVTLVEAYVGVDELSFAKFYLRYAVRRFPNVDEWEKESTTLQLAELIRLRAGWQTPGQAFENTPGWQVLEELLPNNAAAVRRAFVGKIGLALSGGGFRAALFHIGVLARLAELDVLRQVEVLSCVSGGSIIGAHYYLAVRHLLQTKRDEEIRREDYIKIVQDIEREFLAGVQKNVRTRVISNGFINAKMIFFPNKYSRTQRTGDLYEKLLYSRAGDGEGSRHSRLYELFIQPILDSYPCLGKRRGAQPRYLNELLIQPFLGFDRSTSEPVLEEDFAPRQHNWRRAAKVPVLILNATALNTGHTWQFTAAWMGEPPPRVKSPIDRNDRLARTYYSELPPEYQRFRLGQAVGASSCVPGLFDPLVLADLYPDQVIRLVDGGVHDNQGVAGLLDQDCTVLLISDASGQTMTEANPSQGALGVLFRSDNLLQARVRDAQYLELAARQRALLLKGLMFIHLRKDLDSRELQPMGVLPPAATPEPRWTPYGIPPRIQRLLAALRTDLDSFSDIEAYALMFSGYRMTEWEFPRAIGRWPVHENERADWHFLALEDSIRGTPGPEQLAQVEVERQLAAGSQLAFKVWQLSAPLKKLARLLLVLGLIGIFVLLWMTWDSELIPSRTVGWAVGKLAYLVVPILLGYFVNRWLLRFVLYRETLRRILAGVILSVAGWAIAWIHLWIFDWLFLRQAKITALPRPARPLSEAGDGGLQP